MLKIITEYPMYAVNEKGQVYSLFSKRFLKPSLGSNGYYTVELFNDNGSKRICIHRLVAKMFCPNENNYPCVNHKDENKLNNNADNLEWCTYAYNVTYGTAVERRRLHTDYSDPKRRIVAIENGKKVSRPVNQYDKEGNFITSYSSAKEAYRQTKINQSHILDCCHRNKYRKTAGGYKWDFRKEE